MNKRLTQGKCRKQNKPELPGYKGNSGVLET